MERQLPLPAPLLYPVCGWVLGIILASTIVLQLSYILAVAIVIWFLCFLTRKPIYFIMLFFCLGSARWSVYQQRQSTALQEIAPLWQEKVNTLQIQILSPPTKTHSGYWQYKAKLLSAKNSFYKQLQLYEKAPYWFPGEYIKGTFRVRELKPPMNPAEFNTRQWLLDQGIIGTAWRLTTLSHHPPEHSSLSLSLVRWRASVLQHIERRFPYHADNIKTLILAEPYSDVEWREVLVRGGLLHLIAVSGMHIVVMWFAIAAILQFFFPKSVIRLLLIPVFILYAYFCGWVPSALRSVIMMSLLQMSLVFYRKVSMMQLLSISLFLITAISPEQLFQPGLQFSFLCVWILCVVSPIVKKSTFYVKYIPAKPVIIGATVDLLFITIMISLLLIPLSIYHFNRYSLNGVIVNLVGIPLMSAILPLAMLILVLPPFPMILQPFQNSFAFLWSLFDKVSMLGNRLPFYYDFVPFPTWKLLLTLVCTIMLLLLISSFLPQTMKKWLLPIFLSTLVVIAIPIRTSPQNVQIYTFAMGDADCHMVRLPSGQNIMIDSGGKSGNMDTFRFKVLPFLRKEGINTIDLLVLTHPHEDHCMGIQTLSGIVHVKKILISRGFQLFSEGKPWLKFLNNENLPWSYLQKKTIFRFGTATVTCFPIPVDIIGSDPNNSSIVTRLSYGKFGMLFTGDLSSYAEEWLCHQKELPLSVTALKVAHHGSNTSTGDTFLSATSPDIALIPCESKGWTKRPSVKVKDRLHSHGVPFYTTEEWGALRINIDKTKYTLQSWIPSQFSDVVSLPSENDRALP